eukprot:3603760-Rhodomonas_salina.2
MVVLGYCRLLRLPLGTDRGFDGTGLGPTLFYRACILLRIGFCTERGCGGTVLLGLPFSTERGSGGTAPVYAATRRLKRAQPAVSAPLLRVHAQLGPTPTSYACNLRLYPTSIPYVIILRLSPTPTSYECFLRVRTGRHVVPAYAGTRAGTVRGRSV